MPVSGNGTVDVRGMERKSGGTFCPECGALVKEGAKFCMKCGVKLSGAEQKEDKVRAAVRGMRAGRAGAFDQLYEHTKPTALAVIRRYCDHTEDYEDILQETYIRVYKSIDALQDEGKVQAWINKIAANTAIRHNMKKRPTLFTDMGDEEGNIPDIKDENENIDPEAVTDHKAVTEIIRQVLSTLPEDQRDALWMVYGQGITIKEMAESLGISENTIKSRLFQGRKKLVAKKEEFRRLGINISVIPVSILVSIAFKEEVYADTLAAAGMAGSAFGAGAAKAAAGNGAAAGGSASAGASVGASSAGAGTAAGAASAGGASSAGAAVSAGAGAVIKAGAAAVKMGLGVKIAAVGIAAVAVTGGAATAALVSGHSPAWVENQDRDKERDAGRQEERLEVEEIGADEPTGSYTLSLPERYSTGGGTGAGAAADDGLDMEEEGAAEEFGQRARRGAEGFPGLPDSAYDNEMNRQAVEAYRGALETLPELPEYTDSYPLESGLWLWDVNQDGILEMLVGVNRYGGNGEYFYAFSYDGTLKMDTFEAPGASAWYVAVIPEERRIITNCPGYDCYVYSFDGDEFVREEELSFSWHIDFDSEEAERAMEWFEKATFITAIGRTEIDSALSGIGQRGTELQFTGYDIETNSMKAEYFYGYDFDEGSVRPAFDDEALQAVSGRELSLEEVVDLVDKIVSYSLVIGNGYEKESLKDESGIQSITKNKDGRTAVITINSDGEDELAETFDSMFAPYAQRWSYVTYYYDYPAMTVLIDGGRMPIKVDFSMDGDRYSYYAYQGQLVPGGDDSTSSALAYPELKDLLTEMYQLGNLDLYEAR